MKKTNICFMLISLLLVCAIMINLSGCSKKVQADDLMEDIIPNEVTVLDDISSQNSKVTDFALRLFQASMESSNNTLISPLSVLCALAMTANGAEGETLAQIEEVLGMTTEDLNLYLYSYMKALPQGESYKLSLANSIWFTNDNNFTVKPDFLQTNADYYGADIYKAPFDSQTLKDINTWVDQSTDGMIPEILDRIPDEAVMYLVNALAFEADWASTYTEDSVRDGEFIKEDGTKQDAQFMCGSEQKYLEDENATGFIKYYQGGKYAFAALLPNEGISISDYIASLDGEALNELLANPQRATVYTSIPKFETEYSSQMSDVLKEMGMPKAFDPDYAEFGALGVCEVGNIYINEVFHKTFISVTEMGTKAGAATAVEMSNTTGMPKDPKEVHLTRPFVYLLIDCENNIPFFIGTMLDIAK